MPLSVPLASPDAAPSDTETRVLNRRFRAGEEAAIRTVYARYGGAMFAVAMSILGDRKLAADCVQQAFVEASRGAATFDTSRELRPWLATITRRAAIDHYRREVCHRPSETDSAPDPTAIPLTFARTRETFEVRAALDALPGEEREVVRLAHYEQMPHTEIAAKLGIPVGTVTSTSHRAQRRLATLLADVGDAAR